MTQKESAKKGLGYWLRQAVQMMVILTVVSVAVDWYRTQDIATDTAPSLVANTVAGLPVDLIEQSHKEPVIVYFWATWCPACKFVSPSVSWLAEHYSVVAVSSASGEEQRVAQFLQSKDYQFENVNDPNNVLMRKWGVQVTPTIFIVNQGKIDSITTGVTTPIGIIARVWFSK